MHKKIYTFSLVILFLLFYSVDSPASSRNSLKERRIQRSIELFETKCPEYARSAAGSFEYLYRIPNLVERYYGRSLFSKLWFCDYGTPQLSYCGLNTCYRDGSFHDPWLKKPWVGTYNLHSLLSYFGVRDGFDHNSIFSDFYLRSALVKELKNWLGTRYRLGGRSKRGVDCSNFVSVLLRDVAGIFIPAGASTQARYFSPIRKLDALQFGDLIFFTGTNWRSSRIGHVGVYLGNGVFAHSSSSRMRGVVFSHIDESSYLKRFRFGGRLTQSRFSPAAFI